MARENDIIVHVIDTVKATAFIKERLNAPEDANIEADRMAIVNGKNGLATVVTEGVGWFADKNGGIPINYYSGNYGSGGYIDITEDELKSLISSEVVNLADHIRSFGDRLETNFYIWRQYALGYPQDIMSVANATMVA